MAKFSGTTRRPRRINPIAPIRTTDQRTATYEGGEAFVRDQESELFLLAATNMVDEDTFYERAADPRRPLPGAGPVGHRPPTRPSSPAPTRRPVGSAWPSTCASRCACGRPRW